MNFDKWSDEQYRTTLLDGKRYHINLGNDLVWRVTLEGSNRIIATGLTYVSAAETAQHIIKSLMPRITSIVVEGKDLNSVEYHGDNQVQLDESVDCPIDDIKVYVTHPTKPDMSMCMHISPGGVFVTTYGASEEFIDDEILQELSLEFPSNIELAKMAIQEKI